jgi:hypothetical protein
MNSEYRCIAARRCGAIALAIGLTFSAAGVLPASATITQAQKHAAQSWYQQVISSDLAPLDSALVPGLQAASAWRMGKESAAAAAVTISSDIPDLMIALGSLQGQKPLAGQAGTLADYRAAIGLYVEAFQLENTATQLPAGPLVTQLQRSFVRIRELGDETFDEGTARLTALLGPSVTGVDARAASIIPDWSALRVAPGEPLEPSWSGTKAEPSGSQSPSGWAAAVNADDAPSVSSVRAALDDSPPTPSHLSHLARSLQQSEIRLGSVPGPAGDPQASAELRLGLLVDAEAALAAEAGDLAGIAPVSALVRVASALASVGAVLRHQPSAG